MKFKKQTNVWWYNPDHYYAVVKAAEKMGIGVSTYIRTKVIEIARKEVA